MRLGDRAHLLLCDRFAPSVQVRRAGVV